jgi:glyoxylase-like metal-dependent hydrolase (beta-lactamase superfamily II)
MQPHPDPSRPAQEWQRVCDQILQIGCYWGNGGHTELYLLEGDRLALVDTGVADTPRAYVEPALNAIDRSLADVEVVINTHGHHDHAGGNRQLYDAAGCEIWIHAADVAITQDSDEQFELFFARNERLLGREARLPAARASPRAPASRPRSPAPWPTATGSTSAAASSSASSTRPATRSAAAPSSGSARGSRSRATRSSAAAAGSAACR